MTAADRSANRAKRSNSLARDTSRYAITCYVVITESAKYCFGQKPYTTYVYDDLSHTFI